MAEVAAEVQKLKDQGNAAFSKKEFTQAIQAYTDAIDLSPKDHILYSNRSAAFASLQDFAKARADAIKCTQLAPSFAKGWSRLGFALQNRSDFVGAKTAYEKALALDSSSQMAKDGLEHVLKNLPTQPAPSSPRLTPAVSSVKRKLEETGSEKAKRGDLVAELYAPGPMKVKNELVKRLNEFPANKQHENIDPEISAADIEVLSKQTPFAFLCERCDKAKISTLLAKWKNAHYLCHACHDHVIRCVIPTRDLPPSQRPEKCIHQVPLGYQKQYRN